MVSCHSGIGFFDFFADFLPGPVARVTGGGRGLVHVRHAQSLTTDRREDGAQPSRRSLILAALPRRLRR